MGKVKSIKSSNFFDLTAYYLFPLHRLRRGDGMGKRTVSRLWILALMSMILVVGAIAPRPARKAVPARPVQQEASGTLQGKIILVDAGHGGADGGARARDSGIWEKEINLQVAKKLQTALEKQGALIIMTRETDMAYDSNKRADLTARLDLAVYGKADMVVSVHMNEYRSRSESGPQVFYRAGQEKSRLLAGAIQEKMIAQLSPKKKRQAMAGDYYILSLDLPSVLVEGGFLSNAEEEKLLLDAGYQERMAQAVAAGIEEYFQIVSDGVGAQ